jgi:hypothetical protein
VRGQDCKSSAALVPILASIAAVLRAGIIVFDDLDEFIGNAGPAIPNVSATGQDMCYSVFWNRICNNQSASDPTTK